MQSLPLLVFYFASVAALGQPAGASTPRELDGTIGTYAYKHAGVVRNSTVLMLYAPTDLLTTGDGMPLRNVVLVELRARDDGMLQEFGRAHGKSVRVQCELSVAKLWGYAHASCTPSHIAPAL